MEDKPPVAVGGRLAAEPYKNNPEKVAGLLREAQEKARREEKRLGDVWGHLHALFRMLSAWRRNDYTVTPWKSIAWALFALIYFVDPFDFVPDFLPVIGYVDDITVIGFVVNSIRKDIDRYLEWERATGAA